MNLEFIKNIPEFDKYLNEEERIMLETIGQDKFIALYEKFIKLNYYFSGERIYKIRRQYIKSMKDKMSAKQLARQTDQSERVVYKIWQEENCDNLELFEEKQEKE